MEADDEAARHRFDRSGCYGSEFGPQYGEEWLWGCRIQLYGIDYNSIHDHGEGVFHTKWTE